MPSGVAVLLFFVVIILAIAAFAFTVNFLWELWAESRRFTEDARGDRREDVKAARSELRTARHKYRNQIKMAHLRYRKEVARLRYEKLEDGDG